MLQKLLEGAHLDAGLKMEGCIHSPVDCLGCEQCFGLIQSGFMEAEFELRFFLLSACGCEYFCCLVRWPELIHFWT